MTIVQVNLIIYGVIIIVAVARSEEMSHPMSIDEEVVGKMDLLRLRTW